jgi:hypothetical protein
LQVNAFKFIDRMLAKHDGWTTHLIVNVPSPYAESFAAELRTAEDRVLIRLATAARCTFSKHANLVRITILGAGFSPIELLPSEDATN